MFSLCEITKAQELEQGAGRFQPRYHLVFCLITLCNRCNHINPCKNIGSTAEVKNHGGVSNPFDMIRGHHYSKDSEHPKRVEKGYPLIISHSY